MTTTSELQSTGLNGLSDLDHVALSRLLIESVWRVDHGLGHTNYELFTEDGEIRYNGKVFCKGHDALRGWGENRLDPDTVRHIAHNLRFVPDGPDRAKGTGTEIVYYAAEKQFDPTATVPLMLGEWTFECVRTADGWRFESINFRHMFDRRENPSELF